MMDAILPWRVGMDHQGGGADDDGRPTSDDDDDDDDDDRRRVTYNTPATDAPDARFATVMVRTIMSPSAGLGDLRRESGGGGQTRHIWGGYPPKSILEETRFAVKYYLVMKEYGRP